MSKLNSVSYRLLSWYTFSTTGYIFNNFLVNCLRKDILYYLRNFRHFWLYHILKIDSTYFNSHKARIEKLYHTRASPCATSTIFPHHKWILHTKPFSIYTLLLCDTHKRHTTFVTIASFWMAPKRGFPGRRTKRPRDNIRLFESPTNEESSFSQNEGPPREKYEKSERRTLFFFSLLKRRSFLSPRSGKRIEWTYSPSGDHFFSDTNYTVEQSTLFLSVHIIIYI